ncbi:putative multidrug resistance protein fnx1 [Annulohypoxylon maeteangense]|uniref:putative multidrug resistance protein fnx1 n=1 Tax=Annulohypoxylon maeteangense TaxID=1927788 RepID=UPI002008492F|nr:putative multidrug resistance protein fnx1 [Annulohypoxylon maeteangense]KAI0883457.1 putative multidrug resistance protein fnx1 [Annulohypoxylon maeteangense]
MATFLVNLEISIVSTSLVSITDDLKGFSQSSWVVTAYLLTYTSFMIIVAKLSDLFGRKTMLLLSMFVFTAFSGGCVAAQTMVQLIICRAFQGIGGCGVYSIVMVIIFEMVPPAKYTFHYTILTVLYACSMTLGPIVGGVINDRSSWIWVFLLNVPAGVVCMLLVAVSMPNHFPNQKRPSQRRSSINQIDFLGAFLLLAAMTMHLTGLEEAANLNPWRSSSVLTPLCLSGPLWIIFIFSQYYVTTSTQSQEPVFPWRFFQNRVAMGLIINAFLSGAISTTCMIQIPVFSQAAIGISALGAGVHLIPYTLAMEIGAMLVAMVIAKRRLAPVYLALVATVMQLVGVVLLSTGSPESPGYSAMYGIEAVLGLGVGAAIAVTTLMMPYATEKRDLSVGTASIIQFRFMGGATALAIVTAVANTWLRSAMLGVLSPEETALVFRRPDTINSLSGDLRDTVRVLFAKGFNLQMKILIGFAAAQFPVTFLTWKKDQIKID